jgi:hypothetical protein
MADLLDRDGEEEGEEMVVLTVILVSPTVDLP